MFETIAHACVPPEDEALRPAIRALIESAVASMPIDARARSWMGCDVEFSRALAKAGYVGLTLPTMYGGGGRGPFARFVLVEELLAAGAPVAAHWVTDRQSALQILTFGSETQRRDFLPRICRGEIFFCIGMSEPGSGSDLASVRTRADKVDTGWLLNGQKIWTTMALVSDYMIALVRTSGSAEDRHRGLSQVIVDLRAPGIEIRPIRDLAGEEHFAEIFFSDVRLGEDALIGEEGEGWAQVTAELAFERSGPERIYSTIVLLDAWIEHLRGGDPGENSIALAGRLTAELATLRALSVAITGALARGESPTVEASLVKDLGTRFEQSVPRLIGDDLASHPDEPIAPALRRALVHCSQLAPAFSIRGGTREILRGVIARGLGLR
jgi:hypothetical protein